MSADLRTALAAIKPGDWVRAQYGETVVEGEVYDNEGCSLWFIEISLALRWPSGNPTVLLTAILEHRPALPDLPAGSVVENADGHDWMLGEDGQWHFGYLVLDWRNLLTNYSPLTLVARGLPEEEREVYSVGGEGRG